MQNTSIRYIYCLVDTPNNRFRLGSTTDELYAPALQEFYCPSLSFQAGYDAAYALSAVKVIAQEYAGLLVDKEQHDEYSVWMSVECFPQIRLALCCMEHIVPPTVIALIALEKEKAQICAQLDKLLGMT